MLSVLVPASDAVAFSERLIALTGSLGVRRELLERTVAERESRTVETPWGPARVKVGAGRVRPEHDDIARIASEHSLPYRAVAEEIARLAAEGTAAAE
jgi:pyridinium-3,5-bisthiocarboxylic acid mononucleotide nickel chelatase